MSFDKALAFILRPDIEGGKSNNSTDKGGLTYRGITQKLYDEYCDANGVPHSSVVDLDNDTVRTVYNSMFWLPTHCWALPEPLDMAVFDGSVNHGQGLAVKLLQGVLDLDADGILGSRTVAAVNAVPLRALCNEYLISRKAKYKSIIANDPTQATFKNGWYNRLSALQSVIDTYFDGAP